MVASRRAIALSVGCLLLGTCATATVSSLPGTCWLGSATCEGIRIGGEPVPRGVAIETWLAERSNALLSRTVQVTVRDRPEVAAQCTLGELGVRADTERMASLVKSLGHTGPIAERIEQARRARSGSVDLPWLVRVDPDAAIRALAPLKDAADELPVAGKLDVVTHATVPDKPGRFVDLLGALERIRSVALLGETELGLERISLPPRASADLLAKIDIREVMSRYQTGFSRAGEQSTRAQNIENAAAKLDGVVLFPHELFSFNAAVGPRTVDNGFAKGWQIFKGEMVEGIGGGTCQVASTLHAAAVFSGLDVIERLPHSRPSAYITMGLDATVVYPVVDLKLRNPFEFPVVIHSYVDKNLLAFELHGQERAARVVFGREILATRAFTRKVEEKPGLAANRIVRKQHGIRGYKVRRTRTIAYSDGSRRTETNTDIYPPTIEEYLVAPGTDVASALPPLEDESESEGKPANRWIPVKRGGELESRDAATPAIGAAGRPGDTVTAACGADCGTATPTIVDSPGVHAPTANQARAPVRILIAPGSDSRRGFSVR